MRNRITRIPLSCRANLHRCGGWKRRCSQKLTGNDDVSIHHFPKRSACSWCKMIDCTSTMPFQRPEGDTEQLYLPCAQSRRTALHIAAEHGHFDCLQQLINASSDRDVLDKVCQCQFSSLRCISLLYISTQTPRPGVVACSMGTRPCTERAKWVTLSASASWRRKTARSSTSGTRCGCLRLATRRTQAFLAGAPRA